MGRASAITACFPSFNVGVGLCGGIYGRGRTISEVSTFERRVSILALMSSHGRLISIRVVLCGAGLLCGACGGHTGAVSGGGGGGSIAISPGGTTNIASGSAVGGAVPVSSGGTTSISGGATVILSGRSTNIAGAGGGTTAIPFGANTTAASGGTPGTGGATGLPSGGVAGGATAIASGGTMGIATGGVAATLTDAGTTSDAPTIGCRFKSDCDQANGPSGCVAPQQSWFCGPVEQAGGTCTSDGQCGGGTVCRETFVPDGAAGSSARVCTDASCTDDSQCHAGEVCRKDPTTRVPDHLICAAPCVTDLDCAPTDTCENSGHCRARTCAECPSYFSCGSGSCVIPSCASDTDCPGGYCIGMFSGAGECAGSLGSCRPVCF